ncbi:MAG: glycyl-tRNA synthetase, partial [Chitinophagaceae bacterium]|nr:glycyl-tRNA synthetase [Chitinophagaceae bacterium]
EIYESLKFDFNVTYEEKDAIGKRYTINDLIGTQFCVAIDHQTLEDNTETILHRDTMQHERVTIAALIEKICEAFSLKIILEKMM